MRRWTLWLIAIAALAGAWSPAAAQLPPPQPNRAREEAAAFQPNRAREGAVAYQPNRAREEAVAYQPNRAREEAEAFQPSRAREGAVTPLADILPADLTSGPDQWTSPDGLGSTLQVMLLLAVVSLAPAVLLMTTSFVRIVVVLGLLRQALGTQQLPPTQVITSLALFLSLLIMSPVWKQVYSDAIVPYTQKQISAEQAWAAGVRPVRQFMIAQIEARHNTDDIYLFLDYVAGQEGTSAGETQEVAHEDVPLQALLPAFMLSELKTAFLIGFQIYLPFLIIDMVVASVMVSMGMMMLPPVLVSLPLKLLLFVLLDGWNLVVGMLLASFQTFT